jgi:hypothetical protein
VTRRLKVYGCGAMVHYSTTIIGIQENPIMDPTIGSMEKTLLLLDTATAYVVRCRST